ncbi:hypothetical protein [Streptomyces alanosinicus]|uniref:HEAT repeat domain-containing protein n=1 Tax=Streptomyces alanosinicus TaxID=68171 RepID=A0A919D6N1_9ACTN|nr:hypothetical protein [Streptomyces alanosinicus]GHE09245.1 hypothetical protein GCM10010339_60880 [Streptomyces alanosinicus]
MSEASVSASPRSLAGAADRPGDPPPHKEGEPAEPGSGAEAGKAESAKDPTAHTEPPRGDVEEHDGPVSEKDALRSLAEGSRRDDAERSEALRAGAIADEIARRLNADTSGTRIGTLALFNADVSFGGGFHTGGARPGGPRPGGVSVLAMAAADIADHTELFVAPESYGEALDALCEQRVLVLTAAPGSGREAVAVNLLGEALAMEGGGAGCHLLLRPAAVLEADWEPPVKNSGYLAALDDGPGADSTVTSAFSGGHAPGTVQWAAIVAALRASGCFLILTGGHDLDVLAAGTGGDQVARHALVPVDPVAIVERRVLGHGGTPDAYADLHGLLERTGAATALREQPTARSAARLASVIRADGDVTAEVARLRDPSEQVRDWFNRYRAPDAVAFALAAAVLEECGYLTVADAAVQLRRALVAPEAAPPDLRFGDRLGHEQQWIRLDAPAEGGFAPPRVRFRNALLSQAIMAYAWNLLDGRRDAVLGWLRGLLNHRDLQVRARAAVAAGVLARTDPQYAVHRFLTTWAGSTSWPLRQAAATALGVAGSHPETADAVWELLHQWARGDASAHQRRLAGTAANAVGGLLGRAAPDRAVAVLRGALDREDDWGTLPSVAWGGIHLIHQGQTTAVLEAYLDWSAPQDLSPMVVKSLSAFVFAVSQPYEKPVIDTPDDRGHTRVPGVPVLLSDLPRYHDRLTELWVRALARRPVQDSALEALHAWIDDYADKTPGSLHAIGALLSSVARRPGQHGERLTWWLEKWAHDRDKPSAGSARLLRTLDRAR